MIKYTKYKYYKIQQFILVKGWFMFHLEITSVKTIHCISEYI